MGVVGDGGGGRGFDRWLGQPGWPGKGNGGGGRLMWEVAASGVRVLGGGGGGKNGQRSWGCWPGKTGGRVRGNGVLL